MFSRETIAWDKTCSVLPFVWTLKVGTYKEFYLLFQMIFTHYLIICWIYLLLASNTWISPSLRGDRPNPREGHSAALIGKRLFIFGGCGKYDDTEIYYDDVYVLNTGLSLSLSIIKVANGRLHVASTENFALWLACNNVKFRTTSKTIELLIERWGQWGG